MAELITMEWNRTPSGIIADQRYRIEATPPVSAGIQRPADSLFREIGDIGEDEIPGDLLPLYVPLFGDKIEAGQVIFVKSTAINAAGFSGTPLLTRVEPVIS